MKGYFNLCPREFEVLELLSKGLSNEDIMAKMFIAKSTLNTYLCSIYGKLGLEGKRRSDLRVKAVLFFLKNVRGLDV